MKKLRRVPADVRKNVPATLEDHGLVRVGWIANDPPSVFSVHFDLQEARSWQNAIYAFRIGGEVVRIGVAAILVHRMHQWEKDLSRALAGEFRTGGPNPWEVYEYRRQLSEHHLGELWARKGPADRVLTVKEERKLILKHDPYLCNDGPSGRKRPPEARTVTDVFEAKAYWKRLNSGGRTKV